MLTTLQKAKTTPVAGNKRKADVMTTDAPPPAPVANGPPSFDDGPSAVPPSARPQVAWPGVPEPKRFHYDTNLAEAKVAFKRARLEFNTADLNWCRREQARLSERMEMVTKLCREDADSINTMNEDIAKLKEQVAGEAAGASAEEFLRENLDKKRVERAAADGAETGGASPPTTSGSTTITYKNERNRGAAPGTMEEFQVA
ncbi:hypothetical protein FPHYL_7335 [Fusarium phyllophilum]|uniref:Uncharacterized protein n=1 Tax=Fusarium phyllophilum TaxID=47803 RepID=A0A8H5NBB1_9HYPO|nr:hypothetical protein FPHYL_7335 [Fusarium phyllophilum]